MSLPGQVTQNVISEREQTIYRYTHFILAGHRINSDGKEIED